jgi:NAD(P)-dependent dehydrogenase (short-subunit alcohol dehydrogenase family)
MAAVRMIRLVLPAMRRQRDGRIVNITTVGGKAPKARALPTTVTRAAGINLTKSLANEYAADNIRVNTICIGLVRTAQIARRAKGADMEAHWAALAQQIPLGRVAHAAELADLFAFLVSDRASYITGTAINFDGGAGLAV